MIDLNNLAIFAKVVETGSIAAAARHLDMPGNTVGRRLAQLEESLGTSLVQRSTRRLHVTAAGNLLYEQCSRQIAELQQAALSLAGAGDEPSGRIRIATPAGYFDIVDMDVFAAFTRRYPALELDFLLDDDRVNLLERGVDLALRTGPLESSTLRSRKLFDVVRVLVASEEYLRQFPVPATPAELAGHRCLLHSTGATRHVWRLTDGRRTEEVPVRGRVCTNSTVALLKASRAGIGIALLPIGIAAADLLSGRLVRVLPDHTTPANGFYALYPGHRQRSRAVQAFVEFTAQWSTAPERLAQMQAALLKR